MRSRLVLILTVLVTDPAAAQPAPSFDVLLPNLMFYTPPSPSRAEAISPNGTFVAGASYGFPPASTQLSAARWTPPSSAVLLHPDDGFTNQFSRATAINSNGTTAGWRNTGWEITPSESRIRAHRWGSTSSSIPLPPGLPDTAEGRATGISENGFIVIGNANEFNLPSIAWRWTPGGGTVPLIGLNGLQIGSSAEAISNDAQYIVGGSTNRFGQGEAYRWSSATGMVGLGMLPGGQSSHANGISGDGNLIVGYSDAPFPEVSKAVLWTQFGKLVDLGDLPGGAINSSAIDVSNTGVVIGTSSVAVGEFAQEPFVWDALNGMRRLETVMNGLELFVPSNLRLVDVTGISDDGLHITGNAKNLDTNYIQGWRLTLPEPSTALLLCFGLAFAGSQRRSRIPRAP